MALRCNACGSPYAPGSVHNCPAQERAEAALSDALERQWSQQECIGPEPEPPEMDTPPASAPGGEVGDVDAALEKYERLANRLEDSAGWDEIAEILTGLAVARKELTAAVRRAAEQGRREALEMAHDKLWPSPLRGKDWPKFREEWVSEILAALADEGRG